MYKIYFNYLYIFKLQIMKKFLLIAVAALVAISASAVERKNMPKAKFNKQNRTSIATPGAFKSIAAKMEAANAFYADKKISKTGQIKSSRRAEEESPYPACYSQKAYVYSTILEGMTQKYMHSDASFLVENGKVYLSPFEAYGLGDLEGVIETGKCQYSGADSVTFTCAVIATLKADGTELTLEPCGWDRENYVPTRQTGVKTFGAYYFKEYNALYIPEILALFAGTEATEVYDEHFVIADLDLQPAADINQYISKGTFASTSYWGTDNDTAGDCQILLSNNGYYIKGACEINPDAWIYMEQDETSGNYIMKGFTYLEEASFYTDATRTETFDAVIINIGLYDKAPTEDYSSTFVATDNADETTTISNAEGFMWGEFVYGTGDNGGYYALGSSKFNILYEPIEDGIEAIKADKLNGTTAVYNLAGQRVSNDYKGMVILNGKKVMMK